MLLDHANALSEQYSLVSTENKHQERTRKSLPSIPKKTPEENDSTVDFTERANKAQLMLLCFDFTERAAEAQQYYHILKSKCWKISFVHVSVLAF